MKKKCELFFLTLLLCNLLLAQDKYTGTWSGELNIAGKIRVVLHIAQSGINLYTGTLDSPDQSAFGIKCDRVDVKQDGMNNTISFSIDKLKLSYSGRIINDTTLSGTFTQGVSIPLDFHRSYVAVVVKEIKRPQTPKPPFPYRSEEVIYKSPDQLLQYGGTITIPQGRGPFPAVILITGSGQQDRDETILSHKPFAVIADALTRDGFIVLRVDDRGMGNSTGNFFNSTTADFVRDVNTGVDYLRSRQEVDDDKIGLLGHSEGGLIAPMIASQRKDIDFIILLAAPGVPCLDLMVEQNAAILRSSGVDAGRVQQYTRLYRDMVNTILNAPDQNSAKQQATVLVNNWLAKTDTATAHAVGFNSEKDREQYISLFVAQLSSPWMKYFMRADPRPYLTNLKKVKVLALNGSRDIQVVSQQNLPAISAALKEGRTKTYETKELYGLNHLLQTCRTCTIAEYGELEETISPVALEAITGWLNKNVK